MGRRGLGSSSKEEGGLDFALQPRDLEGCETMPSLLGETHSLSGPNSLWFDLFSDLTIVLEQGH